MACAWWMLTIVITISFYPHIKAEGGGLPNVTQPVWGRAALSPGVPCSSPSSGGRKAWTFSVTRQQKSTLIFSQTRVRGQARAPGANLISPLASCVILTFPHSVPLFSHLWKGAHISIWLLWWLKSKIMAYSKFSIIAGGDLSVCSEPSVVPGTEWILRSSLRKEELEIMV